MTDVDVERCVMRFRRATGWSWGADPAALVRAATKALPALLAGRLQRIAAQVASTAGTDVTIETLHIHIPITLAELRALPHAGPHELAHPDRASVAVRLEHAIAAALRDTPLRLEGASAVDVDPEIERPARQPEPAVDVAPEIAIARILATWVAAGQHGVAIPQLADDLARAWRVVLERTHEATRASQHEVARQARSVPPADAGDVMAAARAIDARAWLVAVATKLSGEVDRRAIANAIELALQDFATRGHEEPTTLATAHADSVAESSPLPAHRAEPVVAAVHTVASPRATEDTDIACALPFLALVALARTGWLATLDAVASATGLRASLPAIASALAAKLLPAPARGWHRSEAIQHAAATFAGQAITTADTLASSIRALDAHLAPPLTATVRSRLVLGHTPGAPLIVHPDGSGGFHLLECDGLFAFEWSAAPEQLARSCDELVLVPAASATAKLLDALDLGNRRFVTDAAPTRGEAWRRLPGGLCTNDHATPAGQLCAVARRLEDSALRATDLDEEMARRPALRVESMLEHALAQAAVLALADLSWTLFREREPATPVLALRRFADLGAHVSFGADVVRVRVPLGKRHADLFAHHYTGEVHGVPWFDGRTVEICGG